MDEVKEKARFIRRLNKTVNFIKEKNKMINYCNDE